MGRAHSSFALSVILCCMHTNDMSSRIDYKVSGTHTRTLNGVCGYGGGIHVGWLLMEAYLYALVCAFLS